MTDLAINPLHEATAQALRFHSDCADVPYILRAYYAYRHDLPFSYARTMQGRGHDARYYRIAGFGGTSPFERRGYQVGGQPVGFHAWVRAELAADPARLAKR